MSLKGGGRRFDSDVQQESTSTTEMTKGGGSHVDSTNPNTLGRTAPFSPDFDVHQSSTTTSELGTTTTSTGGPVQIVGNPGQLVQIAGTGGQANTLGRTAPLNAIPLTVGPPSMFMTGMESSFTPSTSSMVEKDSGGVVEVYGRSGGSAVSATRQSFSSSSEINTSSSEIRSPSFTAGVSSASKTTATAMLGLGAAAPRSPHTAVSFHSSELPSSPHTAVAFHPSDSHSEEHQETVVEGKQSRSTVTHESASGLMIQVSDVRAGAELVIEPRTSVHLIEEADK